MEIEARPRVARLTLTPVEAARRPHKQKMGCYAAMGVEREPLRCRESERPLRGRAERPLRGCL